MAHAEGLRGFARDLEVVWARLADSSLFSIQLIRASTLFVRGRSAWHRCATSILPGEPSAFVMPAG
jgi:hypothetical protein